MKLSKCRVCGQAFERQRIGQKTCSVACAIQLGREVSRKMMAARERIETKRRKEAVMSRSDWMKKLQAVFNKYIRLRDDALPCISCGRHHQGQYHAGHYLTIGARPELRFDEDNCHKQCAPCNNHLSGNLVNYRIGLIKKIGLERVERLEGHHAPLKLTVDEIKANIETYRQKIKEMECKSKS